MLLSLVVVAARQGAARDPRVRHDRFTLPAFDAYVYMAMADHPAFFTVAPWGYRVLTPWLVHVLPVRSAARGFRHVTVGGLALAGLLLFLFLRRLGNGPWAALAGVLVFTLCPPVGQAVRNPFLAEPVGVVLVLAFLLALEVRAGIVVLALLAVLAALCKEGLLVILLPLVFFRVRDDEGWRPAARAAGIVAVPAVVVALGMPAWWTPQLAGSMPRLRPWAALAAAAAAWREWIGPVLLSGLTPLAALGALRPQAWPLLRRYGYILPVTFATPLVAATYTGEGGPGHFFAADVPRLLIYAVPVLLALALITVDRIWPHLQPAPAPVRLPHAWRIAAGLLAVAATVGPFVLVDRYRRADLRGARDGPYVLAFARETLRAAGRLERGQTVSFDAATQQFAWGESDPGELGRMRWFLREGWGELPHYGTGDMAMRESEASLVMPCFHPRDTDVELVMEVPAGGPVSVAVNGRPLGVIPPGGAPAVFSIPAAALFRGDNTITLSSSGPGARVRRLALVARAER